MTVTAPTATGEPNGADVAHHDGVNTKIADGAAKIRNTLSDEYYRSRLSIIARNRTHDGSACLSHSLSFMFSICQCIDPDALPRHYHSIMICISLAFISRKC